MKVSIEQTEDGMYSVEEEQGMDGAEMPESPGSPQDLQEDAAEGESDQKFSSLDEALNAARAILEGGAASGSKPMMDGEADFVAGFKKARGGEGMGF